MDVSDGLSDGFAGPRTCPDQDVVGVLVCRYTRVAWAVYHWLAAAQGAAAAPPCFRHTPRGQELTLCIDSRVIEDLETAGTRDDVTQRFSGETACVNGVPFDQMPYILTKPVNLKKGSCPLS